MAGTLLLFAIIRAGHGIAFGLLTVSNSTVAIDVMPSSRRGEGIGYYGVSNNLAMAVGPTLSLYIHDSFANFDYIFLLSMVSATIGLICVSTIRMPYRREPILEKPPVSLDRFLLLKGMPEALTLIFSRSVTVCFPPILLSMVKKSWVSIRELVFLCFVGRRVDFVEAHFGPLA